MAQTSLNLATKRKRLPQRRLGLGLRWLRRLAPLITLFIVLAGWQLLVSAEVYPRFLVPAPAEVWSTFLEELEDARLLRHVGVTLLEMVLGLGVGVGLALILGYLIAKIRLLEDMLSPIIVAFQATPTIAYAPLLIIWFGSGIASKIVICAVIVFFPTLMNTVVGIRNVPASLRDLMRSLRANPLQMLVKLELPAALPVLLTGLKTSATLAVIGAVVGEFVGSSEGLGFLVSRANNNYDTPLMFVAIFTMTGLALAMYLTISSAEWFLLRWQRHSER